MPIVLIFGALAVASLVAMLAGGALIGLLTLVRPARRGGGGGTLRGPLGLPVAGVAAPSLVAPPSRDPM